MQKVAFGRTIDTLLDDGSFFVNNGHRLPLSVLLSLEGDQQIWNHSIEAPPSYPASNW